MVYRHLSDALPPGIIDRRVEPVCTKEEAFAALEQVEGKAMEILREEATEWEGTIPVGEVGAAFPPGETEDMGAFM